jgi:hypothetical protein
MAAQAVGPSTPLLTASTPYPSDNALMIPFFLPAMLPVRRIDEPDTINDDAALSEGPDPGRSTRTGRRLA